MPDRTILHCDCNGFFASVECIKRPELRNVPMAVCGDPDSRHGIILAKNELAKKYNINTAETIWSAKKKCPDLVLVGANHDEYIKYSAIVNSIYQRYTDLVEPFGIDESWLDVTGSFNLFGDGATIANELRKVIKEETGLTISVGVSFNKVFAKLGSDYKKPDATTIISRDNFRQLVYPLPVSNLLYVGKAAVDALGKIYIKTIGDLANANKQQIVAKLGKLGAVIHDYANGIDDSEVKPYYAHEELKSVGNSITFKRDLQGIEDLKEGVSIIADKVASRLRKHGVKCYTISVGIKDVKLKTITRQTSLYEPTNSARIIAGTVIQLIKDNWDMETPVRMLSISGSNLIKGDSVVSQLSLFEDSNVKKNEKLSELETAIDKIRSKYGEKSISQANLLKSDLKE